LLTTAKDHSSFARGLPNRSSEGRLLGRGDPAQPLPHPALLSGCALLYLFIFPFCLSSWTHSMADSINYLHSPRPKLLPKDEGTYWSCESLRLIKANSRMEQLWDG